MSNAPRTVEDIYENYSKRRQGLLRALTDDVDDFYQQADPERDNLCLYGMPDGTWLVDLPAEEVPPELPEPCLGINFARDGMQKRDWLSLVAVHSDAWLMSVAFFYAVKLDTNGRARLFKMINQQPTLFELCAMRNKGKSAQQTGHAQQASGGAQPAKKKRMDRPTEAALPSGKPMRMDDLTPALKGRQAELFWPDNKLWYLVEIQSVNPKTKQAKILYATGEEEDLDMEEIIREGHMVLL